MVVWAVAACQAVPGARAVNSKPSYDTQKFIAAACAAYAAALNPPYCSALSDYGFSAEVIAAALASVDGYASAQQSFEAASLAAIKATQERNAAVKALDEWMRRFRSFARVALRGRKELAAKFG